MSYTLCNRVGYAVILRLSSISEKYEQISEDINTYKQGLTPILLGDNSTGQDSGVALAITESLIKWDVYNPLFLQKIPILTMSEQIEWNYKLADFCKKNEIDFEPPSWAVINWGG